jgi:hypothetical protein
MDRQQQLDQLRRLVFAKMDMRQVQEISGLLEAANGELPDTGLSTGLLATYARPFTRQEVGALSSKWRRFPDRPDLAKVHSDLIYLRNKVYAHTDITGHRTALVWPRGAFGDRDEPSFSDEWPLLNSDWIPRIRELAEYQESRLTDEAVTLTKRLFPNPSESELEIRLGLSGP